MKHKILIALIAILTTCTLSHAAEKEFEKIYNRYSRLEGCESVKIGKAMIKMFSNGNEQLSGIEKILVLTADNNVHPEFGREIERYINSNPGFEEMATIHDGSTESISYFMNSDKGNCIFLMLNTDTSETVVIYINGDFSLKNVSEISKLVKY